MNDIAVLGLVLQAGTLIVGVVWGVARIKSTTDTLRVSIDDLRHTLIRLDSTTNDLRRHLHAIDTRVSVVESRLDNQIGGA